MNGPASPVQRGRESPLSIDEPGTERELAEAQREIRPTGASFLDRSDLDILEAAIAHSRTRLRAQPRDNPSLRIATEWLLDNDYLVRGVFAQLRHELPASFQRRLPRLAGDGRVRALVVAGVILDAMPELDLDELDRFLDDYQERAPLTIAELWALPALLRLAILRRLDELLAQAASEPHALAPSQDVGGAAGRAIRGLRLLAEVDWREVFSRHSAVEQLLQGDPARAYATMEFETRDQVRRVIEDIATASGRDEIEVARAVVARASAAQPDGRCDHVGYWLVDAGRRPFERSLGAGRRGLPRRLLDHPRLTFFGILAAAQLVLLAPVVLYLAWLGAPLASAVAAVVLCWVPSSVPAATLAHGVLSSLIPPRVLPKLDFSRGIPARWRTLVAVPTMLTDDAEIDRLVMQLEVYYLANPDAELRFALLTDYLDSDEPPGDRERAQLARAAAGIDRLNRRHGTGARHPFYLLHRAPRWNPAEGKWMGWERKRGKLDELNRYLRGDTATSYVLAAGEPGGLDAIAFVVTLDSDTELPPGTAARLAGTLAHPLNRPRPDASGRIRAGYTVIQPRVEISPRSARRSAFSRLFAGDTGFDIYSRAVSEVYQDVFGQGIYVGKGIYDVDSFRASLAGRVPENALVSHDLFEGIQGRVALASDVVVYEDYPPNYLAYLRRMHRWIRGDWQLVPWLLPHVPVLRGEPRRNDLGALGRFQILDNLRRSLVAPAVLALLVWGWLVLPGHPPVWTLIALLAPGAAAVSSLVRSTSLPRRHLGRWMLAICFAPQETRTVIDAVVRAAVQMLWTRKRMLEWTPAAADA
ncbi:MAG TPA: glycosyltransferase family 2 protein, partial [Kofleriaceae bacterium]